MNDLFVRAIIAAQHALGWDETQLLLVARWLAAIAAAVSMLSVVVTMRRMRRPIRAQARPIMLGFTVTVAASALYILLMAPPLNLLLVLPLFGLGMLLGLLQGWQTRLAWEGNVLIARRSALYVGLWGFAFVATQALAQLQNAALHASGLLVLAMTLGIGAGSTITVLLHEAWMHARRPTSRH